LTSFPRLITEDLQKYIISLFNHQTPASPIWDGPMAYKQW